MHLAHLSLSNVRSFRRLDLALEPGRYVVAGENGQGKSNLLEAVQMLATARTLRSGTDLDLISWDAVEEDLMPAARLEAAVNSTAGRKTLEIAVIAQETPPGIKPTRASRRFRVNGVARRASDLIGQLRVVMFSADDLDIIAGAPALRRRYLDITISQFDPAYLRALQRYQRVLEQRNSLLRKLQERRGRADELDFWDEELATAGALIVNRRAEAIRDLARDAQARYGELAPTEREDLAICYEPRLPGDLPEAAREHDLAERFQRAIVDERREDVRRGVTRWGPHRDDVQFLIGGHHAGNSASRGQQRTAALALRLAEVELSTKRTGDPPVLLLDDILSELDAGRRERILHAAYHVDQVLITTPDIDRPTAEELPEAFRYRLADGALTRLS
ncbi:MAG: DNA replication/repair protein RecF [Dehalococcoidia bacterium]|nr:DNA replication/repair protein RecF [Dehalococcoidia bacterium]MCA9851331.1 DNA replication/repair protein RecF [Dehalococcoidia bacterium]MCB9482373.1 DNA replication/repair protein RecF [Dehalococcoidia bacterium]MCB9490774.1 DNA replication/repair protein RecF [Dehalococcoidia bacterium]